MKILFKYPTRYRANWFKETLSKYRSLISSDCEHEFLISLNKDDSSMNNKQMIEFLSNQSDLSFYFGNHKSKIEAINADMDLCKDWDILVLVSDDMIPCVKDFDKIIVDGMKNNFPNTDGALHFNDGLYGKDVTITLSIMGRKLYEHFGYIYHPDYKSFYCDNEFTDCVRALRKVVYFPEVIIKHEWRGFSNKKDELYKINSSLGRDDAAVYSKRKQLGFPVNSVIER